MPILAAVGLHWHWLFFACNFSLRVIHTVYITFACWITLASLLAIIRHTGQHEAFVEEWCSSHWLANMSHFAVPYVF